jgi:hypothetical protein
LIAIGLRGRPDLNFHVEGELRTESDSDEATELNA